MTISRLCLLAGFSLLLAACETAEDAGNTADTTLSDTVAAPSMADTMGAAMDTGMAGMDMGAPETLEVEPVDDSGVSGEVTLTPMNEQTEVQVTINGTAGNTTHQGHIHMGTCDNLGEVAVPLEEITTAADGSGSSTTTADMALDSIMNGEHLLAYHAAGGSPGPHITCVEIPAQEM